MIVSLPMYDRPETAAAHDRLYREISKAYPSDLPVNLTRDTDPWIDWQNPDLMLSQTCSLPYRTGLARHAHIVGSPVHGFDDPAGHYHSVIVSRSNNALKSKPKIAINDPMSQSGWAALCEWASHSDIPHDTVFVTGSHRSSAQAVATGHADLAAIDAVTWTLLKRFERFTDQLAVIDRTKSTPALPYITARKEAVDDLFDALSTAIANLSSEDKELLPLYGVTKIPSSIYLNLPIPPEPQRQTV